MELLARLELDREGLVVLGLDRLGESSSGAAVSVLYFISIDDRCRRGCRCRRLSPVLAGISEFCGVQPRMLISPPVVPAGSLEPGSGVSPPPPPQAVASSAKDVIAAAAIARVFTRMGCPPPKKCAWAQQVRACETLRLNKTVLGHQTNNRKSCRSGRVEAQHDCDLRKAARSLTFLFAPFSVRRATRPAGPACRETSTVEAVGPPDPRRTGHWTTFLAVIEAFRQGFPCHSRHSATDSLARSGSGLPPWRACPCP